MCAAIYPTFYRVNFHGRPLNHKICASFLPRKFPAIGKGTHFAQNTKFDISNLSSCKIIKPSNSGIVPTHRYGTRLFVYMYCMCLHVLYMHSVQVQCRLMAGLAVIHISSRLMQIIPGVYRILSHKGKKHNMYWDFNVPTLYTGGCT